MTHTPETNRNPLEAYQNHIVSLAKREVFATDEFRELVGRGTEKPIAFRTVAEKVAGNTENELSEADRSLLMVLGNLGVFAEASVEVDTIYRDADHRRLTDQELWTTRQLKSEYLIPFNHHLKEFINTHPNDEIRTVSTALTSMYAPLFGRHTVLPDDEIIHGGRPTNHEVMYAVQSSLDGMRHEVAAEAMLEAAGYTFDYNVSAEEDATGDDMFVYLESGWQGVDIKASQNAVNSARERHRFSRAVATGLDWGDFKGQRGTTPGALSIPFATAQEKAGSFIERIYAMVQHTEAQRHQVARKAGRRGLQYAHS